MTKAQGFEQLAKVIEYEKEGDTAESRLIRIVGTYEGIRAVIGEDPEEDDRR